MFRMPQWIKRFVSSDGNVHPSEQVVSPENAPVGGEIVTQLGEYLAYFKKRESPGYAVLVTGEWGTGKTFQVLRALKENERYYVSLFGLRRTDDIYAAVYAQMFPIKSKIRGAVRSTENASMDAGLLSSIPFGAIASGVANAFIKDEVKKDRTIIFDDLERSGIELEDRLGVINHYVEHHGCRVVIIAHDEKIAEAFGENKEKLIGQTIRVKPEIEAAYNVFTQQFETEREAKLLRRFKGQIIGVFKQSNAGSLRVLRHAIEDIARLLRELSDEHIANEEAMLELVRLFAAYDIELRAGRITDDAIHDRQAAQYGFFARTMNSRRNGEEVEKPCIVEMRERHAAIDVDSKILTDDVLFSTIAEGIYDRAHIRAAVDDSPHFRKPENAPPWKTFMDFDNLPDEVGEAAMTAMLEQFENREITIPGEMLHVFALQLGMSEKELLAKTFDEVEAECKAYVDALLGDGRLQPASMGWEDREDLSFGYGGYGYWIGEASPYKDHFQRLFRYLRDARKEALRRSLPNYAQQILPLVENDSEQLFHVLNPSHKGMAKFAQVPVLATIDPGEFVATWLRSPSKNWREVHLALSSRVERVQAGDELVEELPWLRKVCGLMEAEAEKVGGLRGFKIRRAKSRIEKWLAAWDDESNAVAEPAHEAVEEAAE
jgi:hypothetical protein